MPRTFPLQPIFVKSKNKTNTPHKIRTNNSILVTSSTPPPPPPPQFTTPLNKQTKDATSQIVFILYSLLLIKSYSLILWKTKQKTSGWQIGEIRVLLGCLQRGLGTDRGGNSDRGRIPRVGKMTAKLLVSYVAPQTFCRVGSALATESWLGLSVKRVIKLPT